jgi:hypothetical protein
MPAKGQKHPDFPFVSEQMKAWSAALADELKGWPNVTVRSFFGFTALYCEARDRKNRMFAALPCTRAMQTPNTLVFKIENPTPRVRTQLETDRRIGSMNIQKARWFTFELSSDSDLHDALDWLGRAYDIARNPATKPRK